MTKTKSDVSVAWSWLRNHPAFKTQEAGRRSVELFDFCINIEPVRVETKRNTKAHLEYWIECGAAPETWPGTLIHDYRLDVSAPTFEEAITKLAAKVKRVYGDYRQCTKCIGYGKVQKNPEEETFTFTKVKGSTSSQVTIAEQVTCPSCKGTGYTKGTYPKEARGVGGKDGMFGPVPFNKAVLLPPKRRAPAKKKKPARSK